MQKNQQLMTKLNENKCDYQNRHITANQGGYFITSILDSGMLKSSVFGNPSFRRRNLEIYKKSSLVWVHKKIINARKTTQFLIKSKFYFYLLIIIIIILIIIIIESDL